jgi:hypothetical protein
LRWINAAQTFVRFGSEADICAAISDVRFTPNSDAKADIAAAPGITEWPS